jgi:hypothetical protein
VSDIVMMVILAGGFLGGVAITIFNIINSYRDNK